ncbi:hypothetical protein TNCV_1438991 [Trichonephila clavipes]|nr:hypothetical protein TNCV_1438991 [Trichonephila clavipes]
MSYLVFEPRPYGTAVSVTNHSTGLAAGKEFRRQNYGAANVLGYSEKNPTSVEVQSHLVVVVWKLEEGVPAYRCLPGHLTMVQKYEVRCK